MSNWIKKISEWLDGDQDRIIGVRDLEGHVMNDANKIMVLNDEDLTNAVERKISRGMLLEKARSPLSLKGVGKRNVNGIYPRYVDTVTGKIYNVFISKYTQEVIPKNGLNVQDRLILMYGAVSSGKTLFTLEMICQMGNLLNFTDNEGNRMLYNQAASRFDYLQKDYHYHRDIRSFRSGYLPEPTPINDILQRYPMSVQCMKNGRKKEMILQFIDCPGEYLGYVSDKLIETIDEIYFLVDGYDFVFNPVKTEESIQQLMAFKETFPGLENTPMKIILTKADAVKRYFAEKEDLEAIGKFPINTLKYGLNNSNHVPEYKESLMKYREQYVRKLFMRFYPGLYAQLEAHEASTEYFLIAALSEEPVSGKIPVHNQPFRVEEPLISSLRSFNLY